jgi:hypothetical protein
MESTHALTEQDRDLLRHARYARSVQTGLNVMLALVFTLSGGLVCFALYAGVQFDRDIPIYISIAVVCFALALGLWFWIARQRRRLILPLHQAIESGQKRVVCGMLTLVERLPDGRLRYTIDGEAFEVDVLLGLDTRMSYLFGRSLDSFRHLNDVAVELHSVALGPRITLLLQVQYPGTPPITRSERLTDAGDRSRAVARAKTNTLNTLGALCLVVPVIFVIGRMATGSTGFTVGVTVFLVICLLLMLPFIVLPPVLRAYRSTGSIAIEGLVTEVMTGRVRYGRSTSITMEWYRVGGMLFCPAGVGVEGKAGPGDLVKFEYVTRKRGHGDGKLMYFEKVTAS